MVFEGMNKKQWMKILLIIVVITIFRLMVQPFIPDGGPSPFAPSTIVQAGLMPIAFIIYGLVMLGALAVVFVLIQDRLPGTKLMKGLTFSLSFGLLWFIYLIEPLPHGTWQIPAVLYYPVVDGITVASLGLLLGLFIATDAKKAPVKVRMSPGTVALLAIPILFIAGRSLSYNVFHIYSSYAARPFDTLLWALAMGLWIAAMYLMLRPGIAAKSPLVKAAYFGVIVFGVNILLNDMFMPIPFYMPIWGMGSFSYEDMIVRTLVDVVFVTAGVFVCENILDMISGSSQASSQGVESQ